MRAIAFRRALVLGLVTSVLVVPNLSFAQEGGGGVPQAPQTPGNPGGQQPGGGQSGSPLPTPGATQPRQPRTPEPETRHIYLSGQVKLADGSAPPDRVVIERVCASSIRPEGYTDSKGNFTVQLGERNSNVFMDASVAGDFQLGGGTRSINLQELAGCEIRANLPGFISDSVILGFRHFMDDPDIGIIRLRPLSNVEGYTFSITTGTAPKDARKAYENAAGKMKKQKWADAEKDLLKAVGNYPKYAVAWFDLGLAYQRQNKTDDAIRAYQQAIQADSKFINPYGQLAFLAVSARKWEDAEQYTSRMLKLNPYVSPDIYFFSAVANYNLQKTDLAEEHARHAAKLDSQQKIAKLHHLLGVILMDKGEYSEAADSLRLYLKLNPKGPDVETIREQLMELEKHTR